MIVSKEKTLSLTKYLSDLKNKLSSQLPEKHKNRECQYKQFLNNEIKTVSAKLEVLKLAGMDAPKGK
jgi:uncharacterized protein YpmS